MGFVDVLAVIPLRPASSAQLGKITVIVITGLDFAANIWAAHSLNKEERLRAWKGNMLAGTPSSWLWGRARGTEDVPRQSVRRHVCTHVRARRIPQLRAAARDPSCPGTPGRPTAGLASLWFHGEMLCPETPLQPRNTN